MLNHEHEPVVEIVKKMNPHDVEELVLISLRAARSSLSIREASEQLLRSCMTIPRQPYIEEIQEVRDMVDVALYSLKVSGRATSRLGPNGVEVYLPTARAQEIEDRIDYMRRLLKGHTVRPTGFPDDDPKILIDAPLSILYPLFLHSSTTNFLNAERDELVE